MFPVFNISCKDINQKVPLDLSSILSQFRYHTYFREFYPNNNIFGGKISPFCKGKDVTFYEILPCNFLAKNQRPIYRANLFSSGWNSH